MATVGVIGTPLLASGYELLTQLGAGTAATVLKARDSRTGVVRAAKVLKPENAANPKILARFEDEFRILRTLHHPHLPEVYDYGWTDDGGRFLIMELVDGVPLDAYFHANPSDIWAILYELCETLTFVHNHNLLHQDIKPSNILVKRTTAFGPDLPLVKLIDFGLTYRRDAGAAVELVGTPEYVAPEVIRGESPLTRAVDYYSLGATLFELLTGAPPFGGTSSEVLRAHLEREAVIDEERLEWAELYPHVRALLTKDRRARLEAFEELRRAVVSRLTGGIEELDRAYGLARAQSPMPETLPAEAEHWISEIQPLRANDSKKESAIEIVGRVGSARSRLVDALCAEAAIRGCYVLRVGPGASPGPKESFDRKQGQVDRFSRTTQRIEALHPTAVLVVINGIELVSDEEASFLRYAVTMDALRPENAARYLFLIARDVGGAEHPLDSYLPQERVPIVLRPERETRGDDTYHIGALAIAALDAALSESQRQILSYVGSHPGPVPREWVREHANLIDSEFSEEVDRLIVRHLLYSIVIGSTSALTPSDIARSLGPSIATPNDIDSIHRSLAARLEREGLPGQRAFAALELVAYHFEAVDEDREGLIARIRAIKSAWREKSLSDVERIAQASLTKIANSSAPSTATRHYFVKQWIRALWLRNQHTKAKQVIDEHIVKRGVSIPASLLPKYVRGILDESGPALALQFVERIRLNRLFTRLRGQVLLEKALLLWHSARYDESQVLLKSLHDKALLDKRDRYRVTIYHAMNLTCIGPRDHVDDLLRSASERAQEDGYHDEFVLMSAIRAQERTIQGQPRESLQIIAGTLRVAHAHELHLRINLLYRLAAAVYQDLGQPRKATRSQQKAITLASTLGLTQFEGMSWIRLAQYERALGNFGNAIRYLEKASTVMEQSSHETERATLHLTKLHLHIWLRSPEAQEELHRGAWISRTMDVNERGRYFMMLGTYLTDTGNWERAWQCYGNASELLQRATFVDNLIMLGRARLRLALVSGLLKQSVKERRGLDAPRLRRADSTSGQLERNLAKLEFAFHRRMEWNTISQLTNACLRQCDESTEARIRLEGLSLVFRVLARNCRYDEAEATFAQFYMLLKSVTSNLHERHADGMLKRLDFAQLAREYDVVRKHSKAGVATSLAQERASSEI